MEQQLLLALAQGIIVLWTARLARSKGLNPWVWGIGSVLLIAVTRIIDLRVLDMAVMAPLIFLLVFRSPLFTRTRRTESTSIPCPSCGAPDTGGLNFCVRCGWDLSRTIMERPESAGEAATPQDWRAEPAGEQQQEFPAAEPGEAAPAAEERPEQAVSGMTPPPAFEPEPVLAPEAAPLSAPEEAPTQPAPPPKEPRPLPTPANLTARGIELFNEGRFQESIDQFTKAIALDPQYREAWKRRAEAYGRLGRPERQQADQRRLEAIQGTSG